MANDPVEDIFSYASKKRNLPSKKPEKISDDQEIGEKQDIFSIALAKKKEMPKTLLGKSPESIQDNEFSEEDLNPSESLFDSLVRHTKRIGSRASEVVVGFPGDILSIANTIAVKPITKAITGKAGLEYEKLPISGYLPTSSKLKETSIEKPKSTWESIGDEIVEDVIGFLIPTGKIKTGAGMLVSLGKQVMKGLGLAVGGQAVKESAKKIGVSEENANYLKGGSMVMGSILHGAGWKGADKHKSSLYSKANSLKAKDAQVQAKGLKAKLASLEKNLLKGSKTDPTRTRSLSLIKETKQKIKRGKISVDELEEMKKSVNVERGKFNKELGKTGRVAEKRNIDNVSHALNEGLSEYGKANPKWYKAYKNADSVHAAIENSKRVTNFIDAHLGWIAQKGMIGLASQVAGGYAHAIPKTVALGAAALGGTKIFETVLRAKNPLLRKYYFDIIGNAAKENAVNMNRSYQKFHKELKKEDINIEDFND